MLRCVEPFSSDLEKFLSALIMPVFLCARECSSVFAQGLQVAVSTCRSPYAADFAIPVSCCSSLAKPINSLAKALTAVVAALLMGVAGLPFIPIHAFHAPWLLLLQQGCIGLFCNLLSGKHVTQC